MKPIDLHFYEDGACCLGIRYAREKNLTIEQFLYQRVIPFFYRLSYTDQYGIKAARTDLWGEYSHEDQGLAEHVEGNVQVRSEWPWQRQPLSLRKWGKIQEMLPGRSQ